MKFITTVQVTGTVSETSTFVLAKFLQFEYDCRPSQAIRIGESMAKEWWEGQGGVIVQTIAKRIQPLVWGKA